MSGAGNGLLIAPALLDPNACGIQVGDRVLQGWKTVSISRSCESMPNSWAVSASAQFLQGAALALSKPGQACDIYIGKDKVITGWIDRRVINVDPRGHEVMLSGRGITRNLVDCSVDFTQPPLQSGSQIYTSCLQLAQQLCAAYKIKAQSLATAVGPTSIPLTLNYGDTPYTVIESVARYCSFLVYEDENGVLTLDQIATKKHASGFTMPGNIEAIQAEESVDGRYSDYLVVWQSVASLNRLDTKANDRAEVMDTELGKTEFRKKIVVSAAVTPGLDFATNEANWLLARSIGRSQSVSVTCDNWRDTGGKLWTPNWMVPIDAPLAGVSKAPDWTIGSVTYRKDASGTHADLVLMPKEAFSPEPNPLNLFDNRLVNSVPTSQSPAPPTTSKEGFSH